MVVESLQRDRYTDQIVDNLVRQADTMYHFVELFNEHESNIEKHQCMEFFICQMQINKRMCEMIDKLIEYDQNYAAQQIILRGKYEKRERLRQMRNELDLYMRDQNKALEKDVYEIKKVICQLIFADKCSIKTFFDRLYTYFEYDKTDERHKYYFIKILGYTKEQLTSSY